MIFSLFILGVVLIVIGWTMIADNSEFVGPIFALAGLISIICMFFMWYLYRSAEYKAVIINKEYGTEYTQDDVFYAEDVIDDIQEIKRTRIEINGDIMKKEKE